jgi:hypothetical protein
MPWADTGLPFQNSRAACLRSSLGFHKAKPPIAVIATGAHVRLDFNDIAYT